MMKVAVAMMGICSCARVCGGVWFGGLLVKDILS
jgi:hypothetical protein